MTPEQDNKLYGIKLDALEQIKDENKIPYKDIAFALKGGGACRFFTELFYESIGDKKVIESLQAIYKEKSECCDNRYFAFGIDDSFNVNRFVGYLSLTGLVVKYCYIRTLSDGTTRVFIGELE